MSDEEIYSPDEQRAFHLVGEFLGWFARLEAVIDRSIIDLLELEPTTGQLLMTYLNFSSKCTILQELASADGVGLSTEERREAKNAIGKIRKLADTRNIIAHSMFSPSEAGIKFSSHGQKKIVSDRSTVIEESEFRKNREIIAQSWSNIASLAAQIKSKTRERRIAEIVLQTKLALVRAEPGSRPN
ncbi:hypothetical protein [Bradyrhizobium lablabi]|uniref:hypothetical protein n=1 Tax=Bradyrhizobium lablabi TaxID=722472 RepID=UPI00090A53A5|nr:hypothetical protein [Bradyrhizobium lablabi]SHL55101.1 hypothetical protein SAMN05444321_3273 [Bradyrhizobium lablabi]